ncbi:hypothetical protein GCM10028805_54510 [Spirosoma harenae]
MLLIDDVNNIRDANSEGVRFVRLVSRKKEIVTQSVVQGSVLNKQTLQPVRASLTVVGDKSPMQSIPTSTRGQYEYEAPLDDVSNIVIQADGYEPLRETFNINKATLTKNFFLTPMIDVVPPVAEPIAFPKPNEPIVLKNVLFELSTATLLPESFPALNSLADIMGGKPAINIRLEGHTDRIGDPAKNLTLSKARVLAVKRYLIQKGIGENRITTKGYGDTKTICTPPCEANRRVEFVVTEQ